MCIEIKNSPRHSGCWTETLFAVLKVIKWFQGGCQSCFEIVAAVALL